MNALADERIPVIIVTGFLGSGKTTLLNRLLRDPRWADTLVIVNELGEVGLDHLLIESAEDTLLLLDSGCLCCALQGGFRETLADLYVRRVKGAVPRFARVIVETTGLADPGPVANALAADSLLRAEFRLAGIVTTVDAFAGAATLSQQWEAVRQVAMADLLVLTKLDLASARETADLRERLAALNPIARRVEGAEAMATLCPADFDTVGAQAVLTLQPGAGADRSGLGRGRLDRGRIAPDAPVHDPQIVACSAIFDQAVDWPAIAAWQRCIVEDFGRQMLRVKALLRLEDAEGPVVLHGIGAYFHPPERRSRWPSEDRRSRLVCIGRAIDAEALRESLALLVPHTGAASAITLP